MREGRNVVLIVEDDPKLLESINEFLRKNGYEVICAQTGKEGLKQFFSHNHEIDIVLLDVMLPEMDGFQVLKSIREYSQVPIMITTSQESEEDQLKGLTSGADNYITKPFRLRVLLAHIQNLLNRYMDSTRTIQFGKLVIEVDNQRLIIGEQEILLTPKEFSLLLYFVQNRNKVLSRETILDSVWGYDYEGDIRTVDTLVKQLRKKLGDECPYLYTVYGAGYCLKEE